MQSPMMPTLIRVVDVTMTHGQHDNRRSDRPSLGSAWRYFYTSYRAAAKTLALPGPECLQVVTLRRPGVLQPTNPLVSQEPPVREEYSWWPIGKTTALTRYYQDLLDQGRPVRDFAPRGRRQSQGELETVRLLSEVTGGQAAWDGVLIAASVRERLSQENAWTPDAGTGSLQDLIYCAACEHADPHQKQRFWHHASSRTLPAGIDRRSVGARVTLLSLALAVAQEHAELLMSLSPVYIRVECAAHTS